MVVRMRLGVVLCTCLALLSADLRADEAAASAKPPEGAVVLFDGTNLDQWESAKGGPAKWKLEDGAMVVARGAGDIVTKQKFKDCKLHLEFNVPATPGEQREQARGNSGVFLQRVYEIQILNSHGFPLTKGSCGAVYNQKPADVNASTPPETWQTYDITYRAPRFAADGKKTANARVTVVHNGQTIHDDVEIPHATRGPKSPDATDAADVIVLQDHQHPVKFRNIWIVPLDEAGEGAQARTDRPEEVVLFDGKSTTGWKQCGPGEFKVVDGALVTSGGMGMLWHQREFADFVLKLQYQVEDKRDNAGVFVRFPSPGNDPWVAVNQGHEIQIQDGDGGKDSTGAIYSFKDATGAEPKPPGQWNDYEVRVAGQTYTVTLNGKKINEFTSPNRPLRGHIGLQNHDPGSVVRFRNVTITELPETEGER